MPRRAGPFALASIALVSTLVATQPDQSPSAREPIPGELRLIDLYQEYHDCIVKVKFAVKSIDKFGKEQVALTVQSGFYIDAKGTVLTNAVPTQEGPRVRIEKDGIQLLAVPIASDTRSNISLLQVAKPPVAISFINIEQHATDPAVGSLAYSITSPLDLAPTPKLGIVTGRESSFAEIEFPCSYTRVSIPSGPAEGGSPVFASDGSLIGVSVASLPDVNSSYVVPTRSLQHIVAQLRETGNVFHPSLEAEISERVDPTTLKRSLVIEKVRKDSVASQSGLLAGDQILAVQGKKLARINELRDTLFFSQAGQFISFTVRREEEEREIALLLENK